MNAVPSISGILTGPCIVRLERYGAAFLFSFYSQKRVAGRICGQLQKYERQEHGCQLLSLSKGFIGMITLLYNEDILCTSNYTYTVTETSLQERKGRNKKEKKNKETIINAS